VLHAPKGFKEEEVRPDLPSKALNKRKKVLILSKDQSRPISIHSSITHTYTKFVYLVILHVPFTKRAGVI